MEHYWNTQQLALIAMNILHGNISISIYDKTRIVKFNGRPMSTSEVYYAVSAILDGTSKERIVLEHGT